MLTCIPNNLQTAKPYIRRLRPQDEAKFIDLLTAVYGDSYSYQDLYNRGNFSSLVQDNKLISYGEFSTNEQLISHSGFWVKEPNDDYVESGVSFRLPHINITASASKTLEEWQKAFQDLAQEYSFIHQQCTTLHQLAQRYAKKYMQAHECGIIMNYAENETIRGIKIGSNQMHSLMMTTVLNPYVYPVKKTYVPQAIFSWIQSIYSRLGLPVKLIPFQQTHATPISCHIQLLEDNKAIQLQRRRIAVSNKTIHTEQDITLCPRKTDLIHVPMNSEPLIAAIYPMLIKYGYAPCGIRPHIHQADELIFQRIKPYQHQLTGWLSEMKVASKSTKQWLEEWHTLVQQILSIDY